MRWTSVCLLILFTLAGGCATTAPWPDPERSADLATDLENAIELRLDGEAVDVGVSIEDRLSMAEAVRRSLRHDPSIQITLARVRAAAADSHQARLLPNPIVSVVLRWPESGGSPTVEAGLAAELLSLLRKPGEIDAADKRLQAASARVLISVLDVVAETQRRFVEVQSLDALLPVLEQRARLLDRLVKLARQRLDAGEGTRLDLTTLQAQRVDLDVVITERQIDNRTARLALARLIGEPSATADWTLDPWRLPDIPMAGESAWVTAALKQRPEVQATIWQIEALGADVRLAQWALLEPLEVGVEAERDAGEWSIGSGATVPLPLFDWGQAKREMAEAAVLESLHELTQTRRTVVEEVRTAHLAHIRLLDAYRKANDQLIPLLEQRLKQAESAFRAGQSDVTPLILAEQDLQAGHARLIELERRTAESLIDLYRAVGGPARTPGVAEHPASAPTQLTNKEEP